MQAPGMGEWMLSGDAERMKGKISRRNPFSVLPSGIFFNMLDFC